MRAIARHPSEKELTISSVVVTASLLLLTGSGQVSAATGDHASEDVLDEIELVGSVFFMVADLRRSLATSRSPIWT